LSSKCKIAKNEKDRNIGYRCGFVLTAMLLVNIASAEFSSSVNVSINTTAEQAAISLLIYGCNGEFNVVKSMILLIHYQK
jgi:hypothetical protein